MSSTSTKHFTVARLVGASRAKGAGPREYVFLASTNAVDRQGEVVAVSAWRDPASGWDGLRSYLQNPVILDSHQYQSIEHIVGRATAVELTGRGLEARVTFNSSPRGRLAEQLVEAGDLKAVSVGFLPHEQDRSGATPTHTKVELLEISVVPVPANAEALRLRGYGGRATAPAAPALAQVVAGLQYTVLRWDVERALRLLEGIRR